MTDYIAKAHQITGDPDNEKNLHRFYRLKTEKAKINPTPGTIHRFTDTRQHDQGQ